jgi:hypothetical protein
MRRELAGLALCALFFALVLVRCFDEPSYDGLACNAEAPCPESHLCNELGVCERLCGGIRCNTFVKDASVEDGAVLVDCEGPEDCLAPGPCELVDDRVACEEGRCRYPTKPCDEPPPGECLENDTKFKTYSGIGECEPATGACTYSEIVVDCLDCSTSCLLLCEGMSCTERNGGCRSEGHCMPAEPPTCVYVEEPDLTPCDRGGIGGGGVDGICSGGECVACMEDSHCDDGNACTMEVCLVETSSCAYTDLAVSCEVPPGPCYEAPGACDPADGSCVFTEKAAGTACDDTNLCTVDDRCMDGDCIGSSPLVCDDGDVCTDDSCDPATGCVFSDNTAPCDDGDACTAGDACSARACLPGTTVDCDDGNPCTADSCDPAAGCLNEDLPDGTSCTFPGGTTGMCAQGACVGCTLDEHCDDGNACTSETCSGGNCTYANVTGTCNDGDACTYSDQCVNGTCAGTTITCTSNQCITRACNGTNSCTETIHSGRACTDDGNACTTDTCNAAGPALTRCARTAPPAAPPPPTAAATAPASTSPPTKRTAAVATQLAIPG